MYHGYVPWIRQKEWMGKIGGEYDWKKWQREFKRGAFLLMERMYFSLWHCILSIIPR